jgi:hypothetical protein
MGPKHETVISSKRLAIGCLFAGFLLLLTAVIWHFIREDLSRHWTLHYYGDWRDFYLQERIRYAPLFFADFGFLTLLASMAIFALERYQNQNPLSARQVEVFFAILILETLAVGMVMSISEWHRFGNPCWDFYCKRSVAWAKFLLDPTTAKFHGLSVTQHAGTSLIPPIFIGTLALTGIPVRVAFMIVNGLSWAGIASITSQIAKRHLSFDRLTVYVMLILIFGHLAVMRSLLFLQTDPIALLFVTLAIFLNLEFNSRPSFLTGLALVLTIVSGFFVKITFLPTFAVPVLIFVLARKDMKPFWGQAAVRTAALVLLPLAVCAGLLFLSGLNQTLATEIKTHHFATASYYKDHNPLRFMLCILETFQFLPLLLLTNTFKGPRPLARTLCWILILLYPGSLILFKAVLWLRYFLPVIPFLALLAAPPAIERLGRGLNLILFALLYVLSNVLFLVCRLFN